MKIYFLLILLIWATPLMAQVFEYKLVTSLRYDEQTPSMRERIQNRTILDLSYHFSSQSKIVTRTSTGHSYSSDWSTLKSIRPHSDQWLSPRIGMRQFYYQYHHEGYRLQMGAIPTIKNLSSSTGIDKSGWIDGVRLEISHTPKWIIEFVAGSIFDFQKPHFFGRDFKLNFAEIEMSYEISSALKIDATFESFLEEFFTKFELQYRRSNWTFSAEMIHSLHDNGYAYSFHLKPREKFFKDYLGIELSYVFISPNLGLRGELNDDFYTYGYFYKLQGSGAISKKMKWFARMFLGSHTRFSAGVTLAI